MSPVRRLPAQRLLTFISKLRTSLLCSVVCRVELFITKMHTLVWAFVAKGVTLLSSVVITQRSTKNIFHSYCVLAPLSFFSFKIGTKQCLHAIHIHWHWIGGKVFFLQYLYYCLYYLYLKKDQYKYTEAEMLSCFHFCDSHGQSHPVFRSFHLPWSCRCDLSETLWGNFSKFAAIILLDWDFGGSQSKVTVSVTY